MMKNYNITVNGQVYQVAVEEVGAGSNVNVAQPVNQTPVTPVQTPQPAAPVAPTASPAPAAPANSKPSQEAPKTGSQGSTKVNAPMPGKILDVKVNVGDSVNKGSVLVILEAMKMENEIVAPADGTVASVNVTQNQTVEPGDVIVTLN